MEIDLKTWEYILDRRMVKIYHLKKVKYHKTFK